jgi:hypothetical protein
VPELRGEVVGCGGIPIHEERHVSNRSMDAFSTHRIVIAEHCARAEAAKSKR